MNAPDIARMPDWDRPVRIPAHVPIRHADPPFAVAGQPGQWRLAFELARDVPAGETLKLQLSSSRNSRPAFEVEPADPGAEPAWLTAAEADGRGLAVRGDGGAETVTLVVPPAGLQAGSVVTAHLGADGPIGATTVRVLNKFFLLYCPSGDGAPPPTVAAGAAQIVAACTLHVLGGPVHHLRAYVPSQVRRGETFSMLVRPEDPYSNLSSEFLGDLAVYADGRELPAAVEPEADSTCVRIGLRLPDEGLYRLVVRDHATGLDAAANPTRCSADEPARKTCWGMIHGHTEISDGTGTLEHYFGQMRDQAALDFAAPGDHDHDHETPDELWELTCRAVDHWNEPRRFVTFLGYEWAKWRRNGDGDRNVYYLQDDRPMYRSGEGACPTPAELFAALADEAAIIIPHHTGHRGNWCDFKDHDPLRERLIEIYQCRGSYECPPEDGNPLPEAEPQPAVPEGYVRRALALGWRVGFTAGGDDHLGHAGTDYPIVRRGAGRAYKAGLMCVQADELTRQAVWDALWNRRVVATSGPRMLLDFALNGRPMGSELRAEDDPQLASRREVTVAFHGTADVERIDVIRNNQVVHTARPGGPDAELSWLDAAPLGDVLLPPAKFCDRRFCFYYVRAVQADGEAAWASPVWIDDSP